MGADSAGRWVAIAMMAALITGCGIKRSSVDELAEGQLGDPEAAPTMRGELGPDEGYEPVDPVRGEELSNEEIEQLLGRVEALEEKAGDKVEFRRPSATLPPPVPGKEVSEAWPPNLTQAVSEAPEADSLEVLGYRPEGEVSGPIQLSVSFSRPMIAVGAHGEAPTPQIRIDPQPEGRWRWLGTRTAVYEADEAWPNATAYEVEVAAGATSVDGSRLKEALRFGFETPPAEVSAVYPKDGVQATDAPIHVVFNQPVQARMASQITVRARRNVIEMREVRGDDAAEMWEAQGSGMLTAGEEGRVITLVPTHSYPPGSTVLVAVAAPILSAEGPIVGPKAHDSTFEVRGSFRVEGMGCREGLTCRPGAPVHVELSNPVADDVDLSEAVEVVPEVRNLQVNRGGDRLFLTGDFLPRITYSIEVREGLVDRFGQRIEGRRSGRVDIGGYLPFVAGPTDDMVVVAKSNRATLPVMVGGLRSLRARVFQVETDDWEAYTEMGSGDPVVGEEVHEQLVNFEPDEVDQRHVVEVALRSALNRSGSGQAVVVIDEPSPWPSRGRRRAKPRWVYWVQVTDLGLDLNSDERTLQGRVTSMANNMPLGGGKIVMGGREVTQIADDGTFELGVPWGAAPLEVHRGGDLLMMPANGDASPWRSEDWLRTYQLNHPQVQWFVIDDRGIYKPGETVTIKGWVRIREPGPRGELRRLEEAEEVRYSARDSLHTKIDQGTARVDAFGGFKITLSLQESLSLGRADVQLATGRDHRATNILHGFQIQEFRRPEYEVSAAAHGEPHRVGEETRFEVQASYYAGGTLSRAPVAWRFRESEGAYTPPGHAGWTFGAWRPYWGWWHWRNISEPRVSQVLPARYREGHSTFTDAQGIANVAITWEAPDGGLPRHVEATASVMDVNRQSWEASTHALVHPAAVYVGLRSEQNFVQRGEDWEVLTRVVDVDGEVSEGAKVEVALYVATNPWSFDVAQAEEIARCSPDGEGRCLFENLPAGSYRAVATVEDQAGRSSVSHLGVWVAGRDTRGASQAEEKELLLIPDKETYVPGDVAEVMVIAPFYPMDATVELRRDGRYETRLVRLSAENPLLNIPIDDAMTPGLTLSVQSVGVEDAASPDAFASGELRLAVEPVERRLNVAIEPSEEETEPGKELGVDVVVTDHEGNTVGGANVALFAVDEAVLGLTNYALLDPLSIFYAERPEGVHDMRTRRWLMLPPTPPEVSENPRRDYLEDANRRLDEGFGRVGGLGSVDIHSGKGSGAASSRVRPRSYTPIAVRDVFDALVFFDGDLVTDAQGRVRVEHTLPDSLTRYRLMAVAVEGDRRFGHGESQVVARLPVMVRPSAPRFANVGDRFELPIVLHNQSGEARSVELALRAVGGLKWLERPGRRVEVPAGERVEVRWKVEATSAGEVRVQVAAASGRLADAELITMPVLTPATTEAFATYGSLSEEDVVRESLRVPSEVFSQYGGLEFSASSTQLQALTDAFIYLTTYPYGCTEQTASRLMSVLALYDVLDAFEAEGLPSVEELRAAQQTWVNQIELAQRGNGGFGFWRDSQRSSPFVSAHATHALWMADEAGLVVSPRVLQRARAYLSDAHRRIVRYSPRAKAAADAYILHVLAKMGVAEERDLDELVTRHGIEELPLEAVGWLLPMASGTRWEARFMQRLQNNAQETAATAEFQDFYTSDAYRILHSGRRTDAVVLDALLQVDAQNPLVEKVMRGLMAHRKRGRWSTTQDNIFVILAMRRYFDIYESVTPEFVARAWVGEAHIAEHAFSGRTGDRYAASVPMSYLQALDDKRQPVVIQRDGEGRMYYRLGMRYAPQNLDLPATSEGIEVERLYEAVDSADDVRRADDGVWEVQAGARVRVTLTMTVPARRYHVALVDWLPAGLEPINTELAVSDVEPGLTGGSSTRPHYWWWSWRWYDHQNTRDERVEVFASLVSPGVHTFSYVARATTPGEFVAPPAKAEEMYHPETFGRSAAERVRVVADAAE